MHGDIAEPVEPTEADEDEDAHGEAAPNGKRYQCRFPGCPQKMVFVLASTFMRHIETQHYPRTLFNCPVRRGCKQYARRDKVSGHCRVAHLKDPRSLDIDGNKVNLPCPVNCALCPRMVRSWPEFYKCFMSHCVIEDEPVDNRQKTPHHNGPGNGGAGPAHGNGPNTPAPKTGGVRGMMSNEGFGGHVGDTQGRGFQSRQHNGNQVDPNQLTALENPPFPVGAGYLASPQPYPTPDMTERRRGSTDQFPPGALPRGQVSRPPPRQQQPSTEALPLESLRCERCPHTLSSCNTNCTLLNWTDGCHACETGIVLPADMASIPRMIGSHRQPYLPGRRSQILRNSGHQMTGRGAPEHGVGQHRQQRRRIQDYRGGGSQRTGGSTATMMVMDVPQPDFSEHELLKSLKLHATKAESTALWLPIRSLPKPVAKILQPESSEIDGMYPQRRFVLSAAFQVFSITNNFIKRRSFCPGQFPRAAAIRPGQARSALCVSLSLRGQGARRIILPPSPAGPREIP